MEPTEVAAFLDRHCRGNPDDQISDAAIALTNMLVTK
jgi:hypothetical protein